MPLTVTLASRNLFQDRLRFAATLIGIVFSVVLVMVQMGLYLGFGRMVTTMIDHASTDLWIVARGAECFEHVSPIDTSIRRKVLAIKGVAEANPIVIGFADWHLPNGRLTPVFVVGANAGTMEPWNIVAGSIGALKSADAVAVDRTYFERLGISWIDLAAKIRDHKVRVAVVTDGIRSFTTTPYVFSDLDRARSYTGLPRNKINDLLVRLKPGSDLERVRHDIETTVPDVEALTPHEFRNRSRSFWLFSTGAGSALFAGALLGVIVGTVIVAQTLYSSTKEHLPEFATLRAMGSSNRYVYNVITWQALLNAVIGFGVAYGIGWEVVQLTAKSALPIVITPTLIVALFLLTVAMCIASAVLAIARVVRIDPVMVLAR